MTTSHSYHMFGMRIRSTVRLLPTECELAEHDVTISSGMVPEPPVNQDDEHWRHASAAHVSFGTPGVGRFLVRDGSEVLMQREPQATDRAIRPYLLGSAVGYLLHQRGQLPLHGSSVAVNGGCVAFLGRRGAGKSTLAALLHNRGYPVVGDDICAVQLPENGEPTVAPGYPRLKLWSNSIQALGHHPQQLEQISDHIEKYAYPVEQSFSSQPRVLKRIYVLHEGPSPNLDVLSAIDALLWLKRFTFRRWPLTEMGISQRQFQICAQIAAQVPVCLFQRPNDLDCIEESVELLERDFRSLSQDCRSSRAA